jgi:serine/threonine protein kinase
MSAALSSIGRGVHLTGRASTWVLDSQLASRDKRSCASVWLARESEDQGQRAAIKLADDAEGQTLVRREIKRLEGLPRSSEHVIGMLDAWKSGDTETPWFAMPVADHGSLAEVYAARGEHPLRELLAVALHIAQGLSEAKVVHRDLRPENLLIYRNGDGTQLRIADWARSIVHGAPQAQEELTPTVTDFAAPQALRTDEDADIRDDLLSIGAIVWWGCTGSAPRIELEDAKRPSESMPQGQATRARLQQLCPAIPTTTVELITDLLRVSRDDRAPALDGRRDYLNWVSERLQQSIAEVEMSEARSGSTIAIGPAAVSATSRSLAAPARRLTGTDERPRDREYLDRLLIPETSRHSPPLLTDRRLPVAELPTTSPPRHGASQADVTDVTRGHTGRQRETVWLAIVVSLVFHVVAGILIFRPAGTLTGPLVAIGALLVSAAVAALDTVIAVRFGRFSLAVTSWIRASTHALVTVRVVIALLVGLFACQAVMVRILSPDLAKLRVSEQRSSLVRGASSRTSSGGLDARQGQGVSSVERRQAALDPQSASLGGEIAKAASGATSQIGNGLSKLDKAQAGRAVAHESSPSGQHASSARNVTTARANTSQGAGEVQLLYRYMQQHSAAVALYVCVLLLVVVLSLLPTLTATLLGLGSRSGRAL